MASERPSITFRLGSSLTSDGGRTGHRLRRALESDFSTCIIYSRNDNPKVYHSLLAEIDGCRDHFVGHHFGFEHPFERVQRTKTGSISLETSWLRQFRKGRNGLLQLLARHIPRLRRGKSQRLERALVVEPLDSQRPLQVRLVFGHILIKLIALHYSCTCEKASFPSWHSGPARNSQISEKHRSTIAKAPFLASGAFLQFFGFCCVHHWV